MSDERPLDRILRDLRERAKELNCLYRVDEILSQHDLDVGSALEELIHAIPPGWQYPEICQAKIVLEGRGYQPDGFAETPWSLSAPIVSEGETIGQVRVSYTEEKPELDEGPFLLEERRLINAIAERIGYRVLQRRLKAAIAAGRHANGAEGEWNVILNFLRGTDRSLLRRITRRMIHHLAWSGVSGADELLVESVPGDDRGAPERVQDNQPQRRQAMTDLDDVAERTFALASRR